MTEPPEDLADPPAIEDGALGLGSYGDRRDLLSDLLGSVRLRGERMVAYAPPPTFSIGFTGIGALHIVEQGEMQLEIDADEHVERVRRGDVILLPRGDAHHISSTQTHAERANEIGDRADDPLGAGQPARWLCGTFTIGDSQASHLLARLPAVIILRGARDQALEWLEVSNYLTHVRLDAAAALLSETSQPVTMIAQKVGYTSEAAFSRAFRQRYGEPPTRWRRTSRSA